MHEKSSRHPPRKKSLIQSVLNTRPVCLWSITLICLCQFYSYAHIIPILIPMPVCVAACECVWVGPLCLCIWGMVFKPLAFRGLPFPTPSTLYVIPWTAIQSSTHLHWTSQKNRSTPCENQMLMYDISIKELMTWCSHDRRKSRGWHRRSKVIMSVTTKG